MENLPITGYSVVIGAIEHKPLLSPVTIWPHWNSISGQFDPFLRLNKQPGYMVHASSLMFSEITPTDNEDITPEMKTYFESLTEPISVVHPIPELSK